MSSFAAAVQKHYPSGGVYVGHVNNKRQRHGKGIYTDRKRNKYSGNWIDGKRNGFGSYTCCHGSKYVGQWKDDQRHGQGTETRNGTKFMGMWSEDKKHGKGTSTDSCGAKVVGFWREGDLIYKTSFTPKESVLYPDGSMYVGMVDRMGRRHGCGEYTSNDHSYVGNWRHGKMHGTGKRCFLKNGNIYVGEWKDGKQHGTGTATDAAGNKFVGQWNDGKRKGGTDAEVCRLSLKHGYIW